MDERQQLLADLLRLDGYQPQEIAEIIKVPENEIRRKQKPTYKKSIIGFGCCAFPALERFMRMNGLSRQMMADKCGIGYASFLDIISGRMEMRKNHIDKILKATGMSYEEAFAEK